MTKDENYGKLNIDVPELIKKKHKLLAKEAGVVLLDEKLILILLILLVKDMKYSNLSTVYSNH